MDRGQKVTADYRKAYGLAVVAAIAFLCLYVFGQPYPDFMRVVSNVIFPLSTFSIAAIAAISVKRYGWKERFGRVWLMLFLYAFLWFLGDLTWATYVFALRMDVPYPSIADFFYIASYVPYAIGILQYLQIFRAAITKKIVLIGLTISTLIAVLSYPYIIHPILTSEGNTLVKALDFAYIGLDFLIQVPLFVGFGIFFKGKIGRSWALFSLAGILNTISDLAFSYFIWQGSYFEGHASEVLYVFAAIMYILAFYSHMKEL